MTKPTAHLPQADAAAVPADIVTLLDVARRAAARSVNALMTASHWEIGPRTVEFEQGGQERAARGQQLLQRLSKDLGQRFGRGFSVDNLEQMRLFYLADPSRRIPATLSRNSSRVRPSRNQRAMLEKGVRPMTGEYRTVRPDVKLLETELEKTQRELEARRIVRGGDGERRK